MKIFLFGNVWVSCEEEVWQLDDSGTGRLPRPLPVSVFSYQNAVEFICSLPENIKADPEIEKENEGGIAFDWENKFGDELTVIVRSDQIIYSMLHSTGERDSGLIVFNGRFPGQILSFLEGMYSE